METREDTTLNDFSTGMLAGLVLNGRNILSERQLKTVHTGFARAFQIVELELGKDHVRFQIYTHHIYGTSPQVDRIFKYWLASGQSTKDAPGVLYRFAVDKDSAEMTLQKLPGGRELYCRAARELIDYLHEIPTSLE